MTDDLPPELARCSDHDLVLMPKESAHHDWCPACELDLPVKLDTPHDHQPVSEVEFRQRLEADTVEELVPLLREYLSDRRGEADVWVTHMRWDGSLPAGYTEQERFVPVVAYAWGARGKYISTNPAAEDTIRSLRNEGYGGE